MEITVSVALPRDSVSVPVIRSLTSQALRILEVDEDCIADIETALSEACTNVLLHAAAGEEYSVSTTIDGRQCIIEVVDSGHGFDPSTIPDPGSEPQADHGRGLLLMRQLVDAVTFDVGENVGTVVRMEKQLYWRDDDAVGKRLDQDRDDRPAIARPSHG